MKTLVRILGWLASISGIIWVLSILSYTWNLKFDRIKNIPIIEYVFEVNLNEIRRDNYYEL